MITLSSIVDILWTFYPRTCAQVNSSLAGDLRSDTQRAALRRQAGGTGKTFVVNEVRGNLFTGRC